MSDDLTSEERAGLRRLLAIAGPLSSLAGALVELEAQPANSAPMLGSVDVTDDGAILYPIACARRLESIGEKPACAWIPVEALAGAFRCRTCGRVEAGGERAARLVQLAEAVRGR